MRDALAKLKSNPEAGTQVLLVKPNTKGNIKRSRANAVVLGDGSSFKITFASFYVV